MPSSKHFLLANPANNQVPGSLSTFPPPILATFYFDKVQSHIIRRGKLLFSFALEGLGSVPPVIWEAEGLLFELSFYQEKKSCKLGKLRSFICMKLIWQELGQQGSECDALLLQGLLHSRALASMGIKGSPYLQPHSAIFPIS